MRILLAQTAGFCMGVRRAMEIAVDATRNHAAPVHTLGPIIHNTQAIELLEARGVSVAQEPQHLADGTVIIRAHGLPLDERQRLEETGLTVVDATCPHVVASQKRIARDSAAGKGVVLVGDPDHPEVRALAGYASGNVWIVSSLAEAEALTPDDPFIVIGQTTFHKEEYEAICDSLKERFPACVSYDSICDATECRQEEARAIASQADVLVVVGGKHSANTRRLAQIGAEVGIPVFHVETAAELQEDKFRGVETVAVTAGASTPGWMTQQVIDRLASFRDGRLRSRLRWLLAVMTRARLLTSMGAVAMSFSAGMLMGLSDLTAPVCVMIACYVFVAYTLNRRQPADAKTRRLVPLDSFFAQNRTLLVGLALVAFAASLVIAASIRGSVLVLMGWALGAAVLYAIPLLPARFRRRRLKDIPASKDIFVAAALAYVTVGVPSLAASGFPGERVVLATGVLVFLMVFAKTAMLDLRDTESDHLLGIETLPVLLGRRLSIHILYLLHGIVLAATLALAYAGWIRTFGFLFCLVPLYGLVALYFLAHNRLRDEITCQVVMDGQLFFAGFLALLWMYAG